MLAAMLLSLVAVAAGGCRRISGEGGGIGQAGGPSGAGRANTHSTAEALAAKLQGLSLSDFFEVSWRELSLRDPESVLTNGLSGVYGLKDAELTDLSDQYVRETYRMCAAVLDLLRRNYDRAKLGAKDQVSYDVYEWYLDDAVRGQEFMYSDFPATVVDVTSVHLMTLHFFTDLHPVANQRDARDYVTRLRQVRTKFDQLIEGLKLREKAGVVPPRFAIQWALPGVDSLARAGATSTPFYTVFETKVNALSEAGGVGPAEKVELLKDARLAIDRFVIPAYRSLEQYLQHQVTVAPPEVGISQYPNGERYYAYLLKHYSTIDMGADDIYRLGTEQLDRIHTEMRAVFDRLGYPKGDSLVKLFDRVAKDSPRVAAAKVIDTYNDIISAAVKRLPTAFDHLPRARVVAVKSPIMGAYDPPSLDGSRPGVFLAGMANKDEALFAMPTLAYHETVPGHHLQIALAAESQLPAFRNMASFQGYTEGWALYAEQLAWELGWYKGDLLGELGYLQAQAFRAARLVTDVGIHIKGWSFDEAVRFFSEQTGYATGDLIDPTQQITRYSVWPGQAVAYELGMLKLLELRQKARDQLGAKFDLKEFHDVVLTNGSMPLGILERVVDDYIRVKRGP